jgi:acetyltransferase-like isoleucine patch superfamily enzyme
MIAYHNARVRRLSDKGSPSRVNLIDRIRTFLIKKKMAVVCGENTFFKKNVKIISSLKKNLRIGNNCLLHEGVTLLLTLPKPELTIGDWVFIGKDTIIASKFSIIIGDYTIFAPRCYVIDHEHGFSADDLILNQKSLPGHIKIGRDCYFGAGTVITSGVTIGDGVIVGANSVVVADIPSGEIWAGVPARFIRIRK